MHPVLPPSGTTWRCCRTEAIGGARATLGQAAVGGGGTPFSSHGKGSNLWALSQDV